jgi:hypothetical protein
VNYHILENKLSHETIDGEVIIINFDNGNYFSLTGVSAAIWHALITGASAETLAAAFPGAPAQTAAEITAFLSELEAEGLITSTPTPSPMSPITTPTVAYETPVLNKYTDMQQLLLADPLHEVDQAGWPHLPQDA